MTDDLETLNRRYQDMDGSELMAATMENEFPGRIALVSSFGAEAAVLLHMASEIDPDVPVIFLDTGKLFDDTLRYREHLIDRLKLTNVRTIRPRSENESAQDPDGALWARDPNRCCHFRKVLPLQRALEGFDAWFTGRKRFQAGKRKHLPVIEWADGRIKVNPIANWNPSRVEAYFDHHDLPRHPLERAGFQSIGCVTCTDPVAPGADPRAGRWPGQEKTECGIHLPLPGATARGVSLPRFPELKTVPEESSSRNIFPVDHTVGGLERAEVNGHRGGVFWFTGLSGSGKSTIAMALERHLFDLGWQVFTLDGDNMRDGLSKDLGFSPEDRSENIRRAAEAAKLLAESGAFVIATFISPMAIDRGIARDTVGGDFHEVFVDASLAVCEARDTKGLYARARAGDIPEFTGISAPYEPPVNPEVHLDAGEKSVGECVSRLAAYVGRALSHDTTRFNEVS